MSDQRSGGRSSATPNSEAQHGAMLRARRSSPLHSAVERPHRRRPAHFPTVESGFRSVIIFLTICTRLRRQLLANDQATQLIIDAWQAADFWCVGRYVIMPDHLHLFCAPNRLPPQPLKSWIAFWRNRVTRAWPNRDQIPLWQREYWDRQLRRGESYDQKWNYLVNNPVRHGLVARAEEWPYQGELNVLPWHD